jgi:type VI protein secretion system component Hcp
MILVKVDGVVGDVTLEGYDNRWFLATGCQFRVSEGKSSVDDDDDLDDDSASAKRRKARKKKKSNAAHDDWDHMELGIDKEADSASVYLMHLAMKSQAAVDLRFLAVEIHILEDSSVGDMKKGVVLPFLKIRLENALISGWELNAEEDGKATESITIWYDKAAMKYYTFKPNAPTQEHGPLGWDQYEGNWKCDALMKPASSAPKGK